MLLALVPTNDPAPSSGQVPGLYRGDVAKLSALVPVAAKCSQPQVPASRSFIEAKRSELGAVATRGRRRLLASRTIEATWRS